MGAIITPKLLFTTDVFPQSNDSADHVAAELYHQLTNEGFTCYVQHQLKTLAGNQCRFDLVVVHKCTLLCIVECKRHRHKLNTNTRQMQRYLSFGVPVIFVAGVDEIPGAVVAVRQLLP